MTSIEAKANCPTQTINSKKDDAATLTAADLAMLDQNLDNLEPRFAQSMALSNDPEQKRRDAANVAADIARAAGAERRRSIVDLEETLPARFKPACLESYHLQTFDTFEGGAPGSDALAFRLAQSQAVDAVAGYINNAESHAIRRTPLLFIGTVGTGKDHLAVAALKTLARLGQGAKFLAAKDLYVALADAYRAGYTHREILKEWIEPPFLLLSDPIEPRNWTPAKADALAKLVHARYNRDASTWITANIESHRQAADLAGLETWDRLREDAEIIICKWPSYRTTKHGARINGTT